MGHTRATTPLNPTALGIPNYNTLVLGQMTATPVALLAVVVTELWDVVALVMVIVAIVAAAG